MCHNVNSVNFYYDYYFFRYVRAEIVAGFVNALFLIFIAFFIFAEAIEVPFMCVCLLLELYREHLNLQK